MGNPPSAASTMQRRPRKAQRRDRGALSQRTPRRLLAACAAAKCARLHYPHEPWAPVHQLVSCGARTTNKASEQQVRAPRSAHAHRGWSGVGISVRWCAHAGERGSNALTIGELSAAQAGDFCCTMCSPCTRVVAVRPRRCTAAELQLEREQPFGNGLRSALRAGSAERTTKPDPDGRFVRRPQGRRTAALTTFARKGQICTYLRLDHVWM